MSTTSSTAERLSTETREPDAVTVASGCPLSEDAQSLLVVGQSPNVFLSTLIQRELYNDAIRFSAYKLTRRKAIWWGSLPVGTRQAAA